MQKITIHFHRKFIVSINFDRNEQYIFWQIRERKKSCFNPINLFVKFAIIRQILLLHKRIEMQQKNWWAFNQSIY